ncbi:MAG TPA: hypothetical protein VED17_08760, partial [Nitrososphaerales archaeon]|nr:hypothetical protein [Nitrososphaerales archaeon]
MGKNDSQDTCAIESWMFWDLVHHGNSKSPQYRSNDIIPLGKEVTKVQHAPGKVRDRVRFGSCLTNGLTKLRKPV